VWVQIHLLMALQMVVRVVALLLLLLLQLEPVA